MAEGDSWQHSAEGPLAPHHGIGVMDVWPDARRRGCPEMRVLSEPFWAGLGRKPETRQPSFW